MVGTFSTICITNLIKNFCINRLVFKKMGEDVTDEELEQIVHLADRDGDGKIGWEDFLAVMLDNK